MIIFICSGKNDENTDSETLILRCLEVYASKKGDPAALANVKIARNSYGKPFFENFYAEFSLSHTRGMKIVAAAESAVGADVEFIRELPNADGIAARFFTVGERRGIKTKEDFFRLWAAKEAYSKYTSLGIASFKTFDISGLPASRRVYSEYGYPRTDSFNTLEASGLPTAGSERAPFGTASFRTFNIGAINGTRLIGLDVGAGYAAAVAGGGGENIEFYML
ncbi:MAG: 4'-phosphopantetheinyl transferase superfamily protein [Clostridiales bacterium]|jgi:hypothetical protein|nr:4'-phosphopantetheinyl transferase superfamily protein [Clostridiales bacterium]